MQIIDDSQMIQALLRLPGTDVSKQENHTSLFWFN